VVIFPATTIFRPVRLIELAPVADSGPVTLIQLVLVFPETVKLPEGVILLRMIEFEPKLKKSSELE
jgi:hypothetical protein